MSNRGWPSDRKAANSPGKHPTYEPTGPEQTGLTVNARLFVYQHAVDLAEAGSTTEFINATNHQAKLGDVIRFNSGSLELLETKVVGVELNRIQVADLLPIAPGVGDQFFVMRPRYPQVDENGNLIVTTTSGPVQFVLDGVDTEVEESTIAPIDSRPLPVKIFRPNGTDDWVEVVETSLAAIELATESTATDMDALEASFGQPNVPVATTDTGTFAFLAFVKRMLTHLSTMITSLAGIEVDTAAISTNTSNTATNITASNVLLGAVTETAPATDTASSGLNGRLQRVAQRITALIALVPASLGSKTAATSFAVTASTEDIARIGIITETAPASDTASSGLNGRLQRVAQRLTSLITLLPVSLGAKLSAASLSVTLATDQTALPTASPVNASGSVINQALAATSASSLVAPANAVGFLLELESSGDQNIRWRVGGAASTTAGMLMEPGRDTGVIPIGTGATVSVCNTVSTAANNVSILWILRV